jgi:RimJ/RimL family protein N-acetyltransferase
VFVHQAFRRRGLGTALVKALLEWGCAAGLRRVWSMSSPDNRAALRLLGSCGFRLTCFVAPAVELEIDLPIPSVAR